MVWDLLQRCCGYVAYIRSGFSDCKAGIPLKISKKNRLGGNLQADFPAT
jgi:hypothetical protein